MNLKNFCEGLAILRPHYDKPDGYHLGAEHDQIFLYATDKPLSEDAVAKMRELEWFQPEQYDDGNEEPAYDPAEGWSAFV